jgi:tryptophan-rich sensory protein
MSTVTTSRTAAAPADRLRQVGVTVAEVFCVLGTLVGTGALGTEVANTSGGSLSADATLLAPAGPAFSIWSVVYAGLAAYTVLQWLPARTTNERDRAIGWWVAASMVLNATWLLVTQQGWVEASVVVILALLGVLVVTVRRLHRLPTMGWADRILVDGTFGLYLGWVAVATFANLASALTDADVSASRPVDVSAALVALAAVVALSAWFVRHLGPRLAVAGATVWGLLWLAQGRLAGDPRSYVVGVAALVAAAAVTAVVHRGRRLDNSA